ncbi:hypothetical protein BDM02DRAFT_3186246 [Thelephora ganbajun]|uniref:Uncharacterized protein n=1 Tax=Thelephora ganbajun TaxID=370292 RepID=A0ACB6ZK12_THEGA|nr:hypothetical protein BDM02DRAFT_3186246 [Thelephora ganbajun]
MPPLRMQIVHTQSLPLLATVKSISVSSNETFSADEKLLEKSLQESPVMVPLSPVDIDDGDSSTGSSPILNNSASSPPAISKRNHALLELLSSERAYTSDLALIRDIHIPLALGQSSPFNPNTNALSSSSSSGSSSRAISIASNSSGSSTAAPPMTKEDARIIFNNVADLALFSDLFTERLEDALGAVLEGGTGQDYVGALFLEMIPLLEPPYKRYITRHPAALEHLNNLPKTPSLNVYLEHTRTLASSLTHAWDLPSLLIKPVQRLLKYSLLLTAVIDGTPDDHPDKPNLIRAKASMDDVARGVNEGRRRREVIKEVLTGGKSTSDSTTPPSNGSAPGFKPKKGLSVGVAASVKLVKGMKYAIRSREGADGNEEKEQVEKMEAELKRCDVFIRKFAKETVDWTCQMKHLMTSLYVWADVFGQVIGISPDSVSEAFDAFRMVLRAQIIPVCEDLETVVQERLLPQLSLLVDSMNDPLRLLEAMHTLESLHYGLLNLDVSKSRPPASLLEASQSYVALRGQLFVELPQFLKLLHKGITATIIQLNTWQTAFYKDAHTHWSELWDALRVDEDSSISRAPETVRIWWERFSIMDEALSELGILKRPKVPVPSLAVGITKTPTMSSSNGAKQVATQPVDIITLPGSAFATGHTPRVVGTPPSVQQESPPRPQPKQSTRTESRSPPRPTQVRKRSGSVPARAKAILQTLEPDYPTSPTKIAHTVSRDTQDGRREKKKKRGTPADVTIPPMELSQSYPRHSSHHPYTPPHHTQYHPQYHHSPRPPPLPHSNTQPIPSANLPVKRPTQRARSHSRGNIEDFQHLTELIGDTSLVAAQTYTVLSGVLDPNAPGFVRKPPPKRDTDSNGTTTDNRASRRSHTSQNLTVPANMEDPAFVSEVVVLGTDSWDEREREVKEDRPKSQRRGSVKKKFADTLENVARKSPSLSSLKRFSGPPRLGSPSPSPGLPQSFSQQQQQQQQGHGRSHSRSRSRPATPRTPSYPTYPTSPPLIMTNSANSSHSQGPYSTPVLYACEAVSPFHLDRDVLYEGIGFHTLEVGTRLGIVQEYGHPCMHPSLPVHIDDGEDCLLLAMDGHTNVGWAFASFLVPVD